MNEVLVSPLLFVSGHLVGVVTQPQVVFAISGESWHWKILNKYHINRGMPYHGGTVLICFITHDEAILIFGVDVFI